ncbi:MAG TPA: Zn-dependent hydrolase [Vineibacter sp.]|nr:Zn-dependent hydrolase [Vineibacter sp.]
MTARPNELRIDEQRFWATMARSAEIGKGRTTGLSRLALGDADKQMRDLFVGWCREAGLEVTVDRMGNIFARRRGRENDLPPVLVGSHLDTQIAAGNYDGILGVLGGLELIRTLDDAGIETRRPIELVNWANEEGARFNPPMLASGVFAGVHALDWALGRADLQGTTYGEELARIGYAGTAPVGGRRVDAYFELHIEQGPILDAKKIPVGIVVGGYATRGLRIKVHGDCAHAGTTAMDLRRNALVGAAYLIVALNELGWRYHPEGGRSTAAQIEVWPNLTGILPEYALVTLDFRHPTVDGVEKMQAEFDQAMAQAAERAQVRMEVAETWRFGDLTFDKDCIGAIRRAAEDLKVPHIEMLSQAGHDAYNMARVCPTAMIFAPCDKGISHNEAENMAPEDAYPGVNVLLHAVLARANR